MAQTIRSFCECASSDYADLVGNDEIPGQRYVHLNDREQLSESGCRAREKMFGPVVTVILPVT